MDYVLVNNVVSQDQWNDIKSHFDNKKGNVISLVSSPQIGTYFSDRLVTGINLIDRLTKRKYHARKYRFFNDLPTPDLSKVIINKDGSISIISDGNEIAKEFLYPNTRRAVQDIRYTNLDGTIDYIEEFASDGSVFSNLFYADGKMQEMDFMDAQERPVVRYYLYDGVINYVTIENPKTRKVIKDYTNLNDFYADQVAEIVKANDTITILYMGQELMALQNTNSHNILSLSESALDEQGNVRGNLLAILTDEIKYIQEVQMSEDNYQALKAKNVPLDKVKVIK